MAEHILRDVKIYIDGVDLSGISNSINMNYAGELKDKTVFGSSARKRIPGLFSVEVSGQGFYDASSQYSGDKTLWDDVGSTEQIMTVIPQGTGLGNIAYSAQKMSYEYQPSYQIGEIASMTFACYGSGAMVRQRVIEAGSISTSLTVTARNLGYRQPKQALYATLHVLRGTTDSNKNLIIDVLTDSSSGFGVAPSTAITLTTLTTSIHVAQWASTQHSTGDNWYKISVVSSGSTAGSILGILTLGNK